MELWTGLANGALGVLLVGFAGRWLLERFMRIADGRLGAFLFTLGLALGRFGAATQMGDRAGRIVGIGLGLAAIGWFWSRKSARRADAMDRPERAGA